MRKMRNIILDITPLVLALWFTVSVIHNTRDMLEQNIKNAPASYALIVALLLLLYSAYNRRFNSWGVIALTILATSATIWIFGLTV